VSSAGTSHLFHTPNIYPNNNKGVIGIIDILKVLLLPQSLVPTIIMYKIVHFYIVKIIELNSLL